MYCKNCGNQIDDNAVVCPHCGIGTGNNNAVYAQPQQAQQHKSQNTLAVVGFILSFFFALIGLIISCVALSKAKKEYNGDGKGFAIAGIVIGALETVIYIIVIAAFYGTLFANLSQMF